MDNALLEVLFEAPEESTRSRETSLRLIRDGDRGLAAIPTDRGVTYPKKPTWVLTRTAYELIFKLEYFASHGMPRHLASIDRRLGSLSMERNFLGRNKYYHLHQWFRDELAVYVKGLLLDGQALSRDYLDRDEAVKAINAHLAGSENNTFIIDELITLELIHRLILKNRYP